MGQGTQMRQGSQVSEPVRASQPEVGKRRVIARSAGLEPG
jgi:hypothetical protein